MKKRNLSRYVLAIVLLLLLQNSQTLIEENFLHQKNRNNSSNVTDVLNTKVLKREKRFLGILIATLVISTSVAIYKQERGCKDITPKLKGRIEQVNNLVKILNVKKISLEKRKEQVEEKIEILKELNEDLDMIRRNISEYNALRTDIVKLIDQTIIDKMNYVVKVLNRDIDNQKEDSIGSLEQLEGKFYDASEYAFIIAANLGGIGLAGRSLILGQLKMFTSDQAAKWTNSNKGRIKKMLNNFIEKSKSKFKSIAIKAKTAMKTKLTKFANFKFTKFGAKFSKFKTGFAKFGKFGKIGSKLGKGLKFAGKILGKVAGVAMIGLEIWNIVEHVNQCKEKMRDADKKLNKLRENEWLLNQISGDIESESYNVDRSFQEIKQNFISDDFKQFLKDVVNLGKGAQNQNVDIKSATNTINRYIVWVTLLKYLDKQYIYDNSLYQALANSNKDLINAFGKINFQLRCLKSKLEVRTKVINNCAKGVSTFSSLYNDAKRMESHIDKQCIRTNYMSKPEIQKLVELAMEKKSLKKSCIRNSVLKLREVCLLLRKRTIAEITRIVSLTPDDVRYFSNQCRFSLSDQQKKIICLQKGQRFTISEVLDNYYHKLYADVRDIYGKCNVSLRAKENVCKLKHDRYTLPDIQQKWNIYSATAIKAVFNECKKASKMTPIDIKQVCSFKKAGISISEAPFRLLSRKYLQVSVEQQYQVCK